MVEECGHGDSLRQGVRGHEVQRDCLRAVGGLGVCCLDLAYEALVLGEREVEVEAEVVVDIALAGAYLDDLVEVGDLVSESYGELLRGGLDNLSGGGVEGQGACVAVLGVDGHVVLEGDADAEQGSELLGDGDRGNVERRGGHRLSALLVGGESEVSADSYPVEVRGVAAHGVCALVGVAERQGLEDVLEQWHACEAVVGDSPVGTHGRQAGEVVEGD